MWDVIITPKMSIKEVRKIHILNTVSFFSGNKTHAAKQLGITRQHIQRILKEYQEEETKNENNLNNNINRNTDRMHSHNSNSSDEKTDDHQKSEKESHCHS